MIHKYQQQYRGFQAITLIWLFILSSFSSAQTQLSFSSDVKIQNIKTKTALTKTSSETYTMSKDEVALISSPDKMPVLVFPASSTSKVDLNLPDLPEYLQTKIEMDADITLGQVFAESMQIQELIQERKLSDAKQRLEALQVKHPNVKFLEFTRASLLFLMGDSKTALQVAEDALQHFPSYRQGQEFVNSLRGS